MSKVKPRFPLKNGERKDLLRKIDEALKIESEKLFGAKPKIEVVKTPDYEIFLVNGKPLIMGVNGFFIPTLIFDDVFPRLPRVTVDMGAVPHICNGADIMAPGIVKINGEFKAREIVVVFDERYGKAIAVAQALFNSETVKTLKRGKIFKNLHYVGDTFWRIMREIAKNERVKT